MYRKLNIVLQKIQTCIVKLHWKLLGVEFGKNLRIHGKVKLIGDPRKLRLGSDVSLNHGVILNSEGGITIKNNVTISSYTQIHSGVLSKDSLLKHDYSPVLINSNVWIASGVVVGPGVVIGANCRIGANSFVGSSLESGFLYAGTPAKQKVKLN